MVAVLGKRLELYQGCVAQVEPDLASPGLLILTFFLILSPQLIFKEQSLPFIVIN